MQKQELAARMYRVAHLTGYFVLRSGRTSHEYFDKYRFESEPEILREIAAHMSELVPPDTEMLAGLETGGIPLATAISLHTGLPALFVRKKAKEYGTRRLAEGTDFEGRRVAVIEDVITTGGQVVESTKQLAELGAKVVAVVCVIDRESGGRENIEKAGFPLRALFTKSELEAAEQEAHREE